MLLDASHLHINWPCTNWPIRNAEYLINQRSARRMPAARCSTTKSARFLTCCLVGIGEDRQTVDSRERRRLILFVHVLGGKYLLYTAGSYKIIKRVIWPWPRLFQGRFFSAWWDLLWLVDVPNLKSPGLPVTKLWIAVQNAENGVVWGC